MSCITDVIFICREAENLGRITDEYFREKRADPRGGPCERLTPVEKHAGGWKVFTPTVALGSFNYFLIDEFTGFLEGLHWQDPAQLLVRDEATGDDRFVLAWETGGA